MPMCNMEMPLFVAYMGMLMSALTFKILQGIVVAFPSL